MAGGFMGRVISYVANELIVNGLANSKAFQRFAVRTSKGIEDISTKAAQKKQQVADQLKDLPKIFEDKQFPEIMAGGFMGRVISYVANELIVNGLANSKAFQRFAVRTSKGIEDISTKAAQKKQQVADQLKDFPKDKQ